jgi:hypothetical protein
LPPRNAATGCRPASMGSKAARRCTVILQPKADDKKILSDIGFGRSEERPNGRR